MFGGYKLHDPNFNGFVTIHSRHVTTDRQHMMTTVELANNVPLKQIPYSRFAKRLQGILAKVSQSAFHSMVLDTAVNLKPNQ